jgi:predicted homoserine dehydrogenase-like protein
MGARHVIDGLDPLLVPARPLGPHQAVPYYLATNATIVRPVARGAILTGADVELPPDGVLLALRREQDSHFAADMVDV